MNSKISKPGLINSIFYHGIPFLKIILKYKTINISHCGCKDEGKIHLVEVRESFGSKPTVKQLCMYHIENETYHGKIASII